LPALIKFLIGAVVISLSGVMAPGAVTAATIAQGTRSKHAGAFIAVGHGIIEIPLIFFIMLGLGTILEIHFVKIGIGLAGGAFLVWMGSQMLRQIRKPDFAPEKTYTTGPIITGFILSISNPYFLLWWASVGLNLAMEAKSFGITAFALFAFIHWLCDLVWLEILSAASFKGTTLLGPKGQRIILAICGAALVIYGAMFAYNAFALWIKSAPAA
jgi:threonine/homoserine/homoserine lactone efflux protein